MHQGRDCATQPEGSADWLTKRGDRMHSFMCLHSFTRSASPHQVSGLSVSHTHTHTHISTHSLSASPHLVSQLSVSHTHTHTHTHTDTHTHTHTHTQTLCSIKKRLTKAFSLSDIKNQQTEENLKLNTLPRSPAYHSRSIHLFF